MPLPLLTADLCREFDTAGTSVHSTEQLRQAESLGADSVTAGHIFATNCKKGLPPKGTAFLSEICRQTTLPVYAIGGISTEKLPLIAEAGAAGACIMSEAMRL
jgi:thiamine-phosphate pyrophosphorylase